MAVAREIEVAVRPEGWEHLVACSVDGRSEIFHSSQIAAEDAHSPDVFSAFSTGHITREVEPVAVGREGRVGIAREGVACDFQLLGLSPCCIRAAADGNGGIAWETCVDRTLCEVHLAPVDRERRGAFV